MSRDRAGNAGFKTFYGTPLSSQLHISNGSQFHFLSVHLFRQISPTSRGKGPKGQTLKIRVKNLDTLRFMKGKIEEGSKGTIDPLRAYARASSEDTSSSLTPEG